MNSLEAALTYTHLGYRVLPLYPGEKRPHGGLVGRGLRDATDDPTIIRAWWAKEPRAGVGVLPGPEVLVLDCDEGGAWERLKEDYPELLRVPRQRTPRAGVHVFLRLPPGLEGGLSASVRRLEGVDLRGMGRAYVVVAPTRLSNGGYVWERPLVKPEELPLVPSALLQKLLPPPPPPPAQLEGASRPPASPQRLRALLDYHAAKIASTPEGGRHLELLRRGLAVAGLIPLGLDRGEAEAALREAGLAAGLPSREVEDLLRWILPRGEARPLVLGDRPPATFPPRVRWALNRRAKKGVGHE